MEKKIDFRVNSFPALKKLIMELKIAFLIFMTCVSSVLAMPGYSQLARVSLDMKNTSLEQVMDEIEKQGEFYFIFNQKQIDVNRAIDIKADNKLIIEILPELFKGTNVNYAVLDRKILLTTEPLENSLSAIETMSETQQSSVSGTITDAATGEPMPGVNIQVKGTTIGAITDVNGKFTLSVPDQNSILMFSFIGYVTQEISLNGKTTVDVALKNETTSLEEVVVVGYGTQKKISVTGAIVSVESEFLLKSPNASISNTLAGRVTGLTTVQFSGRPGADDPSIYVRGIGSLSESSSTPLMLVDGVERSFTQLDPNEIESISILKDASATAVYGIRGANGVIIVTTKRGVEGAPKISITSSFGLQAPTNLVDMADSYTYALKHNEATLNDNPNAPLKFSPTALEAFRTGSQPLIFPNSDWTDILVKPTAFQQQHNINITGGSKIVKYFVSLGTLSQDGLFNTLQNKDSYTFGYNRYNYRANIDIDMTESTKFSITVGGRSENRQRPGSMPVEGDFTVLYWAVPYSGLLYEGKRILIDNTYIASTEPTNKDGLNAIGWGTGYQRNLNNIMNLDIALNQKLDFVVKGLSWRFKVSNNSNIGQSKTRSTSQPTYSAFYRATVDPKAVGDSSIVFRKSGSENLLGYSESSSKERDWYMETALVYDGKVGDHSFTGLLLYNASKRFYPSSFSDIPLGYVGIAARATYNYRSKYMVDMNLGYNGSENFAQGKRFGFFPAGSLGWIISEENFMKGKIAFLDFMKMRVSFGVVGNDRQGSSRFLYMPDSYSLKQSGYGYSFGTNSDILQFMASEGKIGNPNVTWERAQKQNYGIDIRVFKSKLSFTGDYFYELRNNILTTRNTLPSIFSMSLPAQNIGKVENKGYELELKWRNNIGKGNYYLSANMSYARNKVLYKDEVPKPFPYLVETGLRVNERFGYLFDGFWSEEDVTHLSDFPNHMYTPKPGDVKYADLNGDNVINAYDQKPIGFPDYPEYNFSISGGADFKGFDISMLWNGVTNVSRVMNDTWKTAFGNLGDRGLLQWIADNAWTPETASTAQAPRMTFTGVTNNTKTSALWLRDASYLRLKNLELGYTFNANALKRFGISRLRVSTTGYDLITFSKLKMIDPEQRTSSPDYPLVKIYNFGINVTF